MKKKHIIGLSIGGVILMALIIIIAILTKHTHQFGEWEKFTDPTCFSFGVERRFCDCGEVQEKKIDKLPHSESQWIINKEENSRKIICTVCERIIKTESLKNHTHLWSDWTTEKEPTCTEAGLHARYCECGDKETIDIAYLGHSFSNWIVLSESECEIEGSRERLCTTCNFKEVESMPALSHTMGDWVIQGNEKHFPCIYCGISLATKPLESFSDGLEIIYGAVVGVGSCTDKDIVIPSQYENYDVYLIGEQAFEYSDIISIILPDSITTINEDAFYQCSELKIVHLGSSIKSIGNKAFSKCINLKTIHLPDSLTTIGICAFSQCYSLESVYIGNNISKLEMRVFQNCSNLTSIYFNGTINEWNSIEKDSEWDLGTPDYIIYCTDGNINK